MRSRPLSLQQPSPRKWTRGCLPASPLLSPSLPSIFLLPFFFSFLLSTFSVFFSSLPSIFLVARVLSQYCEEQLRRTADAKLCPLLCSPGASALLLHVLSPVLQHSSLPAFCSLGTKIKISGTPPSFPSTVECSPSNRKPS